MSVHTRRLTEFIADPDVVRLDVFCSYAMWNDLANVLDALDRLVADLYAQVSNNSQEPSEQG